MVALFRRKDDMIVLASDGAVAQHVSCLESSHLILKTSLPS